MVSRGPRFACPTIRLDAFPTAPEFLVSQNVKCDTVTTMKFTFVLVERLRPSEKPLITLEFNAKDMKTAWALLRKLVTIPADLDAKLVIAE
jgi:hypothetical protein